MIRSTLAALFCTLVLMAGWIGTGRPAHAQDTATLQGRITDAEDGSGLPLANIRIVETGRGASTDTTGAYRIRGLEPGTYTIAASYIGYTPKEVEVTLAAGATRTLNIALRPQDIEVEDVTVTGTRIEERELSATRLDPADIKTLPTVLEPDVFRSLQLLPGVKAASDFSSGLYIRGGSPDQTLVQLDGAPIYNPSHVFGFFSTFNPDAIGDVLLYKGGFPAPYGGRLGSVVDLESKRGDTESIEGGLSVGLLASRADVEGPYEYGSWMVAARRSTIEPLLVSLNSAGVEDLPSTFNFYDVNARMTFEPPTDEGTAAANRLTASVYAGRDYLRYPFLDQTTFETTYGNQVGSLKWRHLFSDELFTNVKLTGSHYYSDPSAEIASTPFRRDVDVYDFALEGDATWDPAGGHPLQAHTLEGGLKVGSFLTRTRNFFNNQQNFSPRSRTLYGSAYVQDTYQMGDRWEVTAGLRANYYQAGGHWRLAPRASADYQLNDDVRLQLGYGRYYQYLSLVSSEFFSAFDYWLTTDEGVPPSYGDQFVAGVKTQPRENISFDVEVYYRTLRDLFDLDRRISDYSGIPYENILLFGEGYAYGTEVLLRKSGGTVNGFVGYTFGQTRRRFQGFEEFTYYPPKYDRTHDLTMVANYDFADQWRVSAVFTYATGQAYTQPQQRYKLIDVPFSSTTTTVFQSDFNAARLPPYHRLDLGVRRAGRFFGVADYELQLQMINVYGRRNVWFYLFQPQQDNTIDRDTVPQIPIPLPNVSLTLSF